MGIYQKTCYLVEDLFVKLLTRKENEKLVREKVTSYRIEKDEQKQKKEKLEATS
ncbi:hypothetical protein N781_03075 [Pontibacillus halophilus JSM 076056 = DSM 19796]|uniref:Uncharacterized protein n=1 Tax=Pontibacillus halophilus JSM 076056 = DSM 19796 TaxID=1385510 RepID=A0A0A5GLI7_9BACI|nr:hypothetical protein [Pontibacillus halophilus]KGX92083.1 hypothetical protein N781_03075 [Pontibacillus halophilus JSM 076056 = DSM 19796]